jgi:hypothetical protein
MITFATCCSPLRYPGAHRNKTIETRIYLRFLKQIFPSKILSECDIYRARHRNELKRDI